MKHIIAFAIITLLLSSCVGKKKFTAELDARRLAEAREATLRTELNDAKNRSDSLTTQVANLNRQVGRLEYVNEQLTMENTQLKSRISNLSNSSSSQIQALQKDLETRSAALAQKEQIFNDLQKSVQERSAGLKDLFTKIDTTMQFYRTDGIKIEYKEDQQIVVIPSLRLFDPNSVRISRNGMEVLQRLAPLLGGNPNITITVEGHTDNSKPKNRAITDNWALSSDQATAVARVLTKGYDIVANQVSAVGRSEFLPRASNETKEGRAQNQRIEIIIAPKSSSLLRLMERKLSNG
ncbi:MAG: OmpA family protein [Saprospiraceae bacterium]